VLPLLFPLAAGFSLVDPLPPLASMNSAPRERGEEASAWQADRGAVFASVGAMLGTRHPAFDHLRGLGRHAQSIYVRCSAMPRAAEIPHFARQVLTTAARLGADRRRLAASVSYSAVVALCISVVVVPMMLDRMPGPSMR